MDKKSLSELWRYRELVYFLAWRDIKVRYKQAFLGVAWAVVQPLTHMVIFTLVFGKLGGLTEGVDRYPLFVYCGLILWIYASGVIGLAGQSLVSNSNLITKVYFPRLALPFSSAIAGCLDLAISLILLALLMVHESVSPSWSLLIVPVILTGLMMLTMGLSLLFSALNVRFRDVKHVVPFLIQVWMFATPVVYPLSKVPELRFYLALNPLTGIVEGFRASILPNYPFDPMLVGLSLTMALLIFLAGMFYFRRTERAFADVI